MTNEEKAQVRADLALSIAKLRTTKDIFYDLAVRTGLHPFVEFAGLMSVYSNLIEMNAKKMTDDELPYNYGVIREAEDHKIEYIAEKFDCIFGQLFEGKTNQDIFMKAMGWGRS